MLGLPIEGGQREREQKNDAKNEADKQSQRATCQGSANSPYTCSTVKPFLANRVRISCKRIDRRVDGDAFLAGASQNRFLEQNAAARQIVPPRRGHDRRHQDYAVTATSRKCTPRFASRSTASRNSS